MKALNRHAYAAAIGICFLPVATFSQSGVDHRTVISGTLEKFGILVASNRLALSSDSERENPTNPSARGAKVFSGEAPVIGRFLAGYNPNQGYVTIQTDRLVSLSKMGTRTGANRWSGSLQAEAYAEQIANALSPTGHSVISKFEYTRDRQEQGRFRSGRLDFTARYTKHGLPWVDKFFGARVVLDSQDGALADAQIWCMLPPTSDSAEFGISESQARARILSNNPRMESTQGLENNLIFVRNNKNKISRLRLRSVDD